MSLVSFIIEKYSLIPDIPCHESFVYLEIRQRRSRLSSAASLGLILLLAFLQDTVYQTLRHLELLTEFGKCGIFLLQHVAVVVHISGWH